MASHRISGQPWPDATLVSVYPAEAQPAGASGAPAGSAVATATVAAASVLFEGLTSGRRYVAYAAGKSIRFLVQPGSVDTMRPITGAEAQELRNAVGLDDAQPLLVLPNVAAARALADDAWVAP